MIERGKYGLWQNIELEANLDEVIDDEAMFAS